MSSEPAPPPDTPGSAMPRRPVGRKRARAARLVKFGGLAVFVLSACVFVGFLRFAEHVADMQIPPATTKVDAIVVLTGGQQRIEHAVSLLEKSGAHRLFISGVNPTTTSSEIRKLTKSSKSLFDCCVDLGHDAIDTIGNAYETAHWISEKGYRRVFLVTNNYHMPRSLLELRHVDPRTDFIPYPVINSDLKSRNWLREPAVMRRLLSEYVKYSIASLRDLFGEPTDTGLRTDHPKKDEVKIVTRDSKS